MKHLHTHLMLHLKTHSNSKHHHKPNEETVMVAGKAEDGGEQGLPGLATPF